MRGGAYDFIQKPIDRDQFLTSLQRAIEAHALKRRLHEHTVALERCLSELELIVARLGREAQSTGAP